MKYKRETDMAKPVSDWLRKQGYTVYSEVPFWSRCIDMVGLKNEDLCVVELKLKYSWKGLKQACICQLATENVYLAISNSPSISSIDSCKKYGIGLLRVHFGSAIVVINLLKPQKTKKPYESATKHLIENCLSGDPSDDAGKPCIGGNGPAQFVGDCVIDYIKKNPKAGWKEIFENVPNHYSNYKSLSCAMSGYLKMPLYKIRNDIKEKV